MEINPISEKFNQLYGSKPILGRSPGRINLIGEHTDYNNGFVLPAAINKEAVFAVALNNKGKIRLFAMDLNQSAETGIDHIVKTEKKWPNYLLGVVDQLLKRNIKVPGFDCVFGSDIPIGAGLSSSAAIECGILYALNELLHTGFSLNEMAKIAQMAEHEFAGVKCGIMDQYANLFGKKDHVIKLDCRSLEHRYYPLELKNFGIILCDTRVKHSLASSEYNTRRTECETGVRILAEYYPGIDSLRDLNPGHVEEHRGVLSEKVYNRCLFVTSETERVEKACDQLQLGDMDTFGRMMYMTHHGLSTLYEVSCPELDFLVETASQTGVVKGARMMGGGFGGCTINLVQHTAMDYFISTVKQKYEKRFQQEPLFYTVDVTEGTGLLA